MENQHRQITGYRDLSQAEIDRMNEIKSAAVRLGELVDSVMNGTTEGEAKRWAAIAKTQLQQGMMALSRAVALPTTF